MSDRYDEAGQEFTEIDGARPCEFTWEMIARAFRWYEDKYLQEALTAAAMMKLHEEKPDSPCENVKQIAEKYCDDEGYHGLFNEREGCECSIGKSLSGEPPWVCCECVNGDCRPGVLVDGKIVGREPKSHHEKRTDEDIKEEDDRKMNLDGNDFGDS
jgi:hypothetical protein